MFRKSIGTAAAGLLALSLLTAPGASASENAGWSCTANDSEANWTLLATGSFGIPMMPSIPPEGPKVITDWRVQVGPGLGSVPQRLEVFEVRSEFSDYEKIGESALEILVEGTNSFPTRIPVDEGDSVGLYGPSGTLFCGKESGAISMLYEGAVATGETKQFKGAIEVGTPVAVTVRMTATATVTETRPRTAAPPAPPIKATARRWRSPPAAKSSNARSKYASAPARKLRSRSLARSAGTSSRNGNRNRAKAKRRG